MSGAPIRIKFVKLTPTAVTPTKSHAFDAGFDMCADLCDKTTLRPGQHYLYPTGISLQIPQGYYGRIADRSGNAFKYGVHVLGGVIDAGYTGEISILLINLGQKAVEFNPGDRIAQLVITPILVCELEQVSCLDQSERGNAGFGSTG